MKRMALAMSLAVGAVWLSQGDSSLAQGRDGAAPKFLGEKFRYPRAEKGAAGIEFPQLECMRAVTKDDFETVIKHYEKVTGEQIRTEQPGWLMLVREDTFVIDDSKGRDVMVRVFVHDGDNHLVTIVVSRTKGESLTHIAIVFRSKQKRN